MENDATGQDAPTPDEAENGLAGDDAQRRSPEWAGGHESKHPHTENADPEDLPEHEVDEETTVSPENS